MSNKKAKRVPFLGTRIAIWYLFFYCGLCGMRINGDSGTSHTGAKKYYYTCSNKKRFRKCDKASIKKEELEKIVIDETVKLLSDPENISKIADEIIALHSQITREQSVLHLLQDERAKIQTTLNNVMRAIEEGILTPTTKARMNELENSLADINIKISAEEAKLERTLKKSDVEGYIIDALNSDAKTLIEILVEKVTLYEDKIEISFRYSKNTNPDETLTEVHRDFLLCGTKMKITQRCFTAIFELNK